MECACDVDYDDFEEPEFLGEQCHRARKQYKCCECDANINPGDQYWRAVGKWSGKIQTYHTCAGCMTLRKAYTPHGFAFGELWQVLWDCLGLNYITNKTIDDDDEEEKSKA